MPTVPWRFHCNSQEARPNACACSDCIFIYIIMSQWLHKSHQRPTYGQEVSVFNGSMKTKECHIWYQCFCFQWVYEDEGVPYMVSMFLFSMGL